MEQAEPKTSEAISTSSKPSLKKQHLLTIAPELRNRIYHEALKSADHVQLSTDKQPLQPALLRTCRQIREEATGMYYNINDFKILVHDYRGAVTKSFWDVFSSHYKGPMGTHFCSALLVKCEHHLERNMIDDFRAWLEVCHQHPCLAPDEEHLHWDGEIERAIICAFESAVIQFQGRRWGDFQDELDECFESLSNYM